MIYWKSYVKSGDPDRPDFLFRHCEPKKDDRHCLESWNGKEWVENPDGELMDHIFMGEPGAAIITEKEAKRLISELFSPSSA